MLMPMLAPHAAGVRHPLDPEPVRASKAPAVFALGLVATLTGLFVGGLVPATLALLLARQARREAYAAGGFLTGGALIRRGERLAWIGIALAATALVVASVIAIYRYANSPPGQDFGPGVN
jgi:(hydroxyamino)benzene mutase